MDPITLAALVGAFLLFKKPAAPAPSVKPGAGPGNSGPQSVDVGNPIGGAPVYDLATVLAGRHLGVESNAPLNAPASSTAGTSTSTAPITGGGAVGGGTAGQGNLASVNQLNLWLSQFYNPGAGPNINIRAGLDQYASGSGFLSGPFRMLQNLFFG